MTLRQIEALIEVAARRKRDETKGTAAAMRLAFGAEPKMFKDFLEGTGE